MTAKSSWQSKAKCNERAKEQLWDGWNEAVSSCRTSFRYGYTSPNPRNARFRVDMMSALVQRRRFGLKYNPSAFRLRADRCGMAGGFPLRPFEKFGIVKRISEIVPGRIPQAVRPPRGGGS